MHTFRSSAPHLNTHNGLVTIVRELDASEAFEEVGKVYEVETPSGVRFHAFADEITPTPTEQ